ncbi:hypothetical protein [uncultured Nostoc sp.]|uniref:hypothetical protein n=1 Tax=uncultured Nostoc sp. TaxID=340711 RepID=UPI0035CB9A03
MPQTSEKRSHSGNFGIVPVYCHKTAMPAAGYAYALEAGFSSLVFYGGDRRMLIN